MVRKSIITVAILATFGLCATAYAGNNNNASVNQSGNTNNATVTQTSASYSNQSVSNIYFNPGDSNTIDQQGSFNTASVTQAGYGNAGQVQQVNNNQSSSASVDQNGSNLQGYIGQGNSSNATGQVDQAGTYNYANLIQTNSTNVYAQVFQGVFFGPGSGNSAYLFMDNKNGEASNTWVAHDNSLQSTGGGSFIVQELDSGDFAYINEYGGDMQTSAGIYQAHGSSNQATIFQGNENQGFATVEQYGVGGYAFSQQYNGTAEAHIVQYGTGNSAQTYQLDGAPGSVNYAEIDQGTNDPTSANNTASITQSGFSNRGVITQDGFANNASIAQAGTNNNATIHQ